MIDAGPGYNYQSDSIKQQREKLTPVSASAYVAGRRADHPEVC